MRRARAVPPRIGSHSCFGLIIELISAIRKSSELELARSELELALGDAAGRFDLAQSRASELELALGEARDSTEMARDSARDAWR